MDVSIDGHYLRSEFGIAVVDHGGKFTISTRKGNTSFSFPDENGEHPFVDAEDVKFEPNTIELTCVLYGANQKEFMRNYRDFKELLEKPGLRKLKIPQVDGTIHEVYVKGGARINLRGKWKNDNIVSNEFSVPFIEPDPLAAAISLTTSSTASVSGTITTNTGNIIMDWGDGNVETVQSGSSNLSHDYSGTSGDKQIDITFKEGLKDPTEITMSGFGLTGAIPEWLGHCRSLATLNLSSNSLDTYETTKWDIPDGITIDINSNSELLADQVSQWLIDLDNGRPDGTEPINGSFDATGCNGGTLLYGDLSADGQAAHDNLENNKGWTITLDV